VHVDNIDATDYDDDDGTDCKPSGADRQDARGSEGRY
jgi:hypothetical protein